MSDQFVDNKEQNNEQKIDNLITPGDNNNINQNINMQGESYNNLAQNLLPSIGFQKKEDQVQQNNNLLNNNSNNNNNDSNQNLNIDNNIQNSNKNFIEKNNQLNDKKTEVKTFFKRYRKAPRTALEYEKEISYLNSVLQSIGHVKKLAYYFLNNEKEIYKNVKQMPLSFVTSRLFKHFYPYPENPICEIYSAKAYLQVLAAINLIYSTDGIKNPNDLLIFILDTLNAEINFNKIIPQVKYNQFDFNDTIEKNLQIIKDNMTVISKNFNWLQLTESKCSICNKTMFKLLSFNTFNLDIFNSYKENSKKGIQQVSIYDCLNIYKTPKILKLRCDGCDNKFRDLNTMTQIFSGPDTFIFLIDRGINFDKANALMTIPFLIEEKIDLKGFILNEKSTKLNYELTGIVSILLNEKEKKYVSYCVSPIDDCWYYYNDNIVEYTQLEIILKEHNIKKNNVPCILFYRAIPQKK